MIRLYKDPNGETVFTAHEEALQITTALGDAQLNSELNSLRKTIKQLEATITEYKVGYDSLSVYLDSCCSSIV